jgi:NADPH:quinone reductase-like Zn-dependent oxidoreductase
MSKVVRFYEHGGPEQLRIEELDVGDPGTGEVRIRVEAIGLKRSEAMFRAGAYLRVPKFPSLIGYEGVGIVEALGAEVQGFSAGDRVCVMPNYRLGEYGLYGDHAIVPVRSLIAPPPGLTVVEAASIWNKPERFARNRDLILYGLAEGRLKPIIAKTFPLGDIVEAHRYLESNQQVGKIVVTV